MLITHGRMGVYLAAGMKVECRCCVHYGAAPSPRGRPIAWCPERGWHVQPGDNCHHFERAVGTDDA